MKSCVLALDMGTTAFKAAVVDTEQIYGAPAVVKYRLHYRNGRVTCPPERYRHALFRALRQATQTAQKQNLAITGIGICSQAQTFLALDKQNEPLAPAVVWTDSVASREAHDAARALPNYAQSSGFLFPSPLQFLPKVAQLQQQCLNVARFLLLNEWVISLLTGEAYGDATNAGMGGAFDISKRTWSQSALTWAGIMSEQLARVFPAASYSALLKPEIADDLGIPSVPVYSCGNDQSVAAVGAGLERTGDILCNFGTALVVYALRQTSVIPANENQISGLDPSSASGGFLLGLEAECGNVIDFFAETLYRKMGVPAMLDDALSQEFAPDLLPQMTHADKFALTNFVGYERAHIARALLEYYAARFTEILAGVREPNVSVERLFFSGGLSQSEAWRNFLEKKIGAELIRTSTKHPSLVGIARIIAQYHQNG